MMVIQVTIITFILILLFTTILADNPCRLDDPERGVIDLSTVGRTDGEAAYEYKFPPGGSAYAYSYNPCTPFSEGVVCRNVSACQIAKDGIHVYILGTQESAKWNVDDKNDDSVTITYSTNIRTTVVQLQCSTTGVEEFEVLGEIPQYTFRLTHKCACWNGCSNMPSTTTTTSMMPTTPSTLHSCRYEDAEKGVIDLTILGRTDGKAAYIDYTSQQTSNYKYSYNPCKPFSQGPACQNVAVCQVATDETQSVSLGAQESASWIPGPGIDGIPSVGYANGEKTVVVLLQCSTSEEAKFEVLGDDRANLLICRLTHKCACWNGCSSIPSTTTTTTTESPSIDACRFEYPGKGVIDFSFIGRTDERAAYTNEVTRTVSNFSTATYFSFNPCRSFSQGSGCIGVAVCQISGDEKETFTLGTQESASWNPGFDSNEDLSLNYVYGEKKVNILLQCSTEGNNELQAFGEDPVNTFRFRLTHKCACWNGCSKTQRRISQPFFELK